MNLITEIYKILSRVVRVVYESRRISIWLAVVVVKILLSDAYESVFIELFSCFCG